MENEESILKSQNWETYSFDEFSEIEKQVFQMRVINKYNYAHIAKNINRSPTQAKNIYYRCLAKLNVEVSALHEHTPIRNSELSMRSKNALLSLGFTEMGHLDKYSMTTLLNQKNLGTNSVMEIQGYLSKIGLSLCDDRMINKKIYEKNNIKEALEFIKKEPLSNSDLLFLAKEIIGLVNL